MKKRRTLRNVTLVALSAVLVAGTALPLAACKKAADNEISVYIFCNEADAVTNRKICENWATEYNAALLAENPDAKQFTVDFRYNVNSTQYDDQINNAMSSGTMDDIVYLPPSRVRSWAGEGVVLDLSEYLTENSEDVMAVWNNSISFYSAYRDQNNYSKLYSASGVKYDATVGKFVDTVTGNAVGIYGLPKDYSNFALGYNKNYFTAEMKEKYTTAKASATEDRGKTHLFKTQKVDSTVSHDGQAGDSFKYAVDVSGYDNPYTTEVESISATAGQESPIIVVGVPITYKPFNFYRFPSFQAALDGGDPIALAVKAYSPNGNGYTVTIPGFPGETFEVPTEYRDPNATYNAAIGHTVLTYAEYGALTWAMTYYLNTFAWNNDQGHGGIQMGTDWYNVYGAEQYEAGNDTFGYNGYVLPWLFANDANYLNADSTLAVNDKAKLAAATDASVGSSLVSTNYDEVYKQTLDGAGRTAKVQYGMDSQNFLDAYGAFHDFAAIWNGNAGNAGDCADSASDKGKSGWDYFRMGAQLFYGAGTWDAATRNDSDISVFNFGQMPTPVSERLALYTTTRDAFYNGVTYSNASTAKGVGNAVNDDFNQRANAADGLKVYSRDEIIANQLKRQDKWGARMDSVGYAANGNLRSNPDKAAAAASLIMELTINEDAQLTLTYGGAQLPNMVSQCSDFLNYQSVGEEGAFKDMITPDGDAAGHDVWNSYYAIVNAMSKAALGKGAAGEADMTVEQFLAQDAYKQVTDKKTNTKLDVKYDPQYKDVKLKEFVKIESEDSRRAYAMRVLRMINLSAADRDINIRAQYGLNSARDALMYAANSKWLNVFDQSTTYAVLAYTNQKVMVGSDNWGIRVDDFKAKIMSKVGDAKGWSQATGKYFTPGLLCVTSGTTAQAYLEGK